MHRALVIMEWLAGYIAMALATVSVLRVMFTDSPHFAHHFTPLQKTAFEIQGVVVLAVFAVVIGGFVLSFIVKDIPWSHMVGGFSLAAFAYFHIFFSAYRSQQG